MAYLLDDISDSYCTVEPIYDSTDPSQKHHNNQTFLFEFEVGYTKVPVPDNDEEEDYMSAAVETQTTTSTQQYDRDWFIGQDEENIKLIICAILLNEINVPPYRGIVTTFTEEMQRIMASPMENLSKIKVKIDVVVEMFPDEEPIGLEDVTFVNYEVAPVSVEAIQEHLEIVTAIDESVEDCAICLETNLVGSELVVSRLPCEHVFHRTCITKWLKETGICPLCRDV